MSRGRSEAHPPPKVRHERRSNGRIILFMLASFAFSGRRLSRRKRTPSFIDCNQKQLVVKYWEIIADNLKKAGWSLGYVSAVDCEGRTIWIVDAHRGDGQRFIVRADEKLTAFLELKSVIRAANRQATAEPLR